MIKLVGTSQGIPKSRSGIFRTLRHNQKIMFNEKTKTMRDMNEIIVVPAHQVKDMIQSAVRECVTEIIALVKPGTDAESVDMDGAVKFLNANGYKIKKSQLYKLTSSGEVPFHKFGSRLHFRIAELAQWANARLINGNAIGVLEPVTVKSSITIRR